MGENYYELLGVSEDATTDKIESAYREKLKETHPDVSDDEDASERTKRLIDAKETLTDETERNRYDRLGHEAYLDQSSVDTDTTTTASGTQSTTTASGTRSTTTASGTRSTTTASGQSTTDTDDGGPKAGTSSPGGTANPGGVGWASTESGRSRRRGRGRHVRDDPNNDGETTDTKTENDPWRAWSTDRSYAVERGHDSFGLMNVLMSQRAFVMLGTTLVVYPVLLFGALSSGFPLPVNLIVAMCIVLVIAFLQSVPEVGIVVFGTWTILLPILMFVLLGFDPLSLRPLVAVIAVVFPFGLSVLTRIAIRPMSAG